MIIDGKKITGEILKEVKMKVGTLPHVPVVRAITVAPSPATLSYLRIKQKRAEEAGMILETVELQEDCGTDEVIHAVTVEGADAVIVQLPLPSSIDVEEVLKAIPLSKDADILSPAAKALAERGDGLLSPVVGAVKEILERATVGVEGKNVCVIGKGNLVGRPVAHWLTKQGAIVTVLGKEDTDVTTIKSADIVILGAGQGGIVKPEHLKSGVVLIDAGTSESGGAIRGDADPACVEVASVFTPVPGGVGPVAVACLFRNVLELSLQAGLQTPKKAV